VITRIALDHQNVLGDTHVAIAKEKAGILRPKVPLICGVRQPDALRTIRDQARKSQVPRFQIDHDFRVTQGIDGSDKHGLSIEVRGHRYEKLRSKLVGTHQQDNIACAVAALHVLNERGVKVTPAAIAKGLANADWPARMEALATTPVTWLDAAHNVDGCEALAAHLATLTQRPRVLVFGAMQDKDVAAMLKVLTPVTEHRVFTKVAMERAVDPALLAKDHDGIATSTVTAALTRAKKLAAKQGTVIVAGSIFVVAEARAKLLGLETDPLIRM
jgi:dihydrofolate synthase/folylpolyglutamate synthase